METILLIINTVLKSSQEDIINMINKYSQFITSNAARIKTRDKIDSSELYDVIKNLLKMMHLADLPLINLINALDLDQIELALNIYIDDHFANTKSITEIFNMLEAISKTNPEKYEAVSLVILSNKNIRSALLSENNKKSYQSVIEATTTRFENNKKSISTLAAWENWTIDDFESALKVSTTPPYWMALGMVLPDIAPDKIPTSIKQYFERLDATSLDIETIKLLDKKYRIAYLRNLGSWENGKKALGGDPTDLTKLRNVIDAFTHDFIGDDLYNLPSDTLLIASFNEKNIDTIISMIVAGEKKPRKRKLAWQLIEELDNGLWNKEKNANLHVMLHEQNVAHKIARTIAFAPTYITQALMQHTVGLFEGLKPIDQASVIISTGSHIHQLMIPALYENDKKSDAYKLNMNNSLVLKEITENNKGVFFTDANFEVKTAAAVTPVIALDLMQSGQSVGVAQKLSKEGFLPSQLLEQCRQQENDQDQIPLLAQGRGNLDSFLQLSNDELAKREVKPEIEKKAIIELHKLFYAHNMNKIKETKYHGDFFIASLIRNNSPGKWNEGILLEMTFSNEQILEKFLRAHENETLYDSPAKIWATRAFFGALTGIAVFGVVKAIGYLLPSASEMISSVALGPIAGPIIGTLALVTGSAMAHLTGLGLAPIVASIILAAGAGAVVYTVFDVGLDIVFGVYAKGKKTLRHVVLGNTDKIDYKTLESGIKLLETDPKMLYQLINSREMRQNLAKTIQYHQDEGKDIFNSIVISPKMKNLIKLINNASYYDAHPIWKIIANIPFFAPLRNDLSLRKEIRATKKINFSNDKADQPAVVFHSIQLPPTDAPVIAAPPLVIDTNDSKNFSNPLRGLRKTPISEQNTEPMRRPKNSGLENKL